MRISELIKINTSNKAIIERTYYEYHGKCDDGESAVCQYETVKGTVV